MRGTGSLPAPPALKYATGKADAVEFLTVEELDPISIVIPVYNSQDSLPILLHRINDVLSRERRKFELIFVDDGSRDRSWEVVCDLASRSQNVRGVRMLRNYGQHNALLCGIRAVRNPIVLTMDDDLQNPPEEIPKLLSKLDSGYDVVYGTPQAESHGVLRDLASQITKFVLQTAMGAETARNVSAFRVFRTRVARAFDNYRSPYVSIDVLLTWGTQRFASVAVRNDPRTLGTSNYTVGKLIRHALNMMTGFSTLPLQTASMIGFVMTVAGICALVWVLSRWILFGSVVPGFAFLGSMIAIFSGTQFFALGIIGEYIARIHTRTMDRPSYAVDTTTEEKNHAIL
jgi:glycosyltransferase involved in cell wall biosynthesis